MKFLCLGYFDPVKMDARPLAEIDAVMHACRPHMDRLHQSGHVIVDVGLALQPWSLRRIGGRVVAEESPAAPTGEMIGSAFLIEAQDMDEAIRVASMHPTTQMDAGEQFGWRIEIHPVHHFEGGPQRVA